MPVSYKVSSSRPPSPWVARKLPVMCLYFNGPFYDRASEARATLLPSPALRSSLTNPSFSATDISRSDSFITYRNLFRSRRGLTNVITKFVRKFFFLNPSSFTSRCMQNFGAGKLYRIILRNLVVPVSCNFRPGKNRENYYRFFVEINTRESFKCGFIKRESKDNIFAKMSYINEADCGVNTFKCK